MRMLILIPGLTVALALASCGGKQVANNAAVSEDTGAGGITAVNDTTAIDAATGEAANMADNVDYTFNEEDTNATANEATNTTKSSSRTPRKSAPSHQPDEPAVTNNSAE